MKMRLIFALMAVNLSFIVMAFYPLWQIRHTYKDSSTHEAELRQTIASKTTFDQLRHTSDALVTVLCSTSKALNSAVSLAETESKTIIAFGISNLFFFAWFLLDQRKANTKSTTA